MAGYKKGKRVSAKQSKKRSVANKDIGRSKRLSVVNAPLSRTLKAKMLYTSDVGITLISSTTNPGTYVISLNSLHDPDRTGGGHRPRGFNELMVMYDHYTVIGVKARIDIHNNHNTNPAYCIATLRDSSVTATNYIDYTESLNSQWKLLGIEPSGTADKTIMLNINPNEFLGRSHPLSDPQLKGAATSSPVEECFLHISGMALDQFNPCTINCMVTMEYTAIFTEPKQPASS